MGKVRKTKSRALGGHLHILVWDQKKNYYCIWGEGGGRNNKKKGIIIELNYWDVF